jgi:hypothetical protein
MIKIKKIILVQVLVLVIILSLFCSSTIALTNISPVNKAQCNIIITKEIATTVAGTKLMELAKADSYTIMQDIQILTDAEGILGYVFNLQPQGYVVITAFYDLPPVLAYSLTSCFSDEKNGDAPLCTMLKSDIRQRLTHLSIISSDIINDRHLLWNNLQQGELPVSMNDFCQWPSEGSTAYGGWLETTWTQSAPYNNFCPIDLASSVHSVAGCPSVAMAQILNYHETTNSIVFNDTDDYYHNYGGNNYWIDNDYQTYEFPSFPELNNYLNTLVLHYQQQTILTDDDVAALVFACGVASKQVYHPNGSGTFGVNQAFDAYRRFGFTDVKLLDDEDPNVYTHVQENIQNGLPVHLAVVNEAWTSGHNLVIDGYNTEGFYHLNFGWGGPSDGWYLVPDELPYNLNFLEGVIVDIFDAYDESHLKGSGMLNWDSVKKGSTINGSFTLENIGNPGETIDWEIVDYPTWGTWTFTPANGLNLTPESGPISIEVSVKTSVKKNAHYTGHITIKSLADPKDFCVIHVSLTTPKSFEYHSIFIDFLRDHPNLFPLLQRILGC